MALVMLMSTACDGGGEGEDTALSTSADAKMFENPVYDSNFPDPYILRADGTYYAYSTNGDGANVPMLESKDLVNWSQGTDAMPELAPWVTPGKTWAPEVLVRRDSKYVLYYTAASTDVDRQCVGHAIANSPEGPFKDLDEEPLVCQAKEGGSIDASPFRDGDGKLYLYWKNDGNAVGIDTYIYAQELSPDGLNLVGEAVRLFKQDEAWEGQLVEAPFMWKRDGRYYLFFSANAYYNESYAEGYAICEEPLGPCKKASENPILKTANGAAGPGHASIIETTKGETWLVYHAWPPEDIGSSYPGRVLWIDRLKWRNGRPVVKGPTSRPQLAPE